MVTGKRIVIKGIQKMILDMHIIKKVFLMQFFHFVRTNQII